MKDVFIILFSFIVAYWIHTYRKENKYHQLLLAIISFISIIRELLK